MADARKLWILYPGPTREYGGRAHAETAVEAFELIVANHRAGVSEEQQDAVEDAIRAEAGPDDLVAADEGEQEFTKQRAG